MGPFSPQRGDEHGEVSSSCLNGMMNDHVKSKLLIKEDIKLVEAVKYLEVRSNVVSR